MQTHDVFICYNSLEDKPVDQIAGILTKHGIKVWIAKWNVSAGDRWRETVEKAIAASNIGAVFIGASGIGDGMRAEFEALLGRPNIRIIPVLLPDAPQDIDLPMSLKQYVRVDLRGKDLSYETLSPLILSITREQTGPLNQPATSDRHGGENGSRAEALRAYLQRCEVRLSTMHRIAGAFLSGAGLLLLLPLFLKDALTTTLRLYNLAALDPRGEISQLIAVGVMLFVPLFAMYWLIRELAIFYFSANIPFPRDKAETQPDLPPKFFHPRFALTAIPFSDDEGDGIKAKIRELQTAPKLINFVIPSNSTEAAWLKRLRPQNSADTDHLSVDEKPWFEHLKKSEDVKNLRTAFGLAGAYDRSLVEEAAKSELSLIRHNLLLRRLVLRYVKAFILFLWTALVLFTSSAWIGATVPGFTMSSPKPQAPNVQVQREGLQPAAESGAQVEKSVVAGTHNTDVSPNTAELVAISTGKNFFSGALLIWALMVPFLIRAPIRWIHLEFTQDVPSITKSDPHLVNFEQGVCIACLAIGILGVISAWGENQLLGGLAVAGIVYSLAALARTIEPVAARLPRLFNDFG